MKYQILSKLSSLLKENDNSKYWSSTRLAFLFTVAISNITIFGLWLGLSLYENTLVSIPESVLVLYSIANGLGIGGKLLQKPLEHDKYNKPLEHDISNDSEIPDVKI